MSTSSETYRHQCEVDWVIALGDKQRMKKYLDLCEQKRGKPAADRLRTDARERLQSFHMKQNRGNHHGNYRKKI